MSAYLEGAIVQKVERATRDALVVTVRLPRETVSLAVLPGAIGAIDRPAHVPADAFVQRLRKHLEGGRVVGVFARTDGQRLVVRRGEERFALIAGAGTGRERGAVTFVEAASVDGEPFEDGATLASQAREAFARHLAALDRERRRALIAALDGARKKLRRRVAAVEGDLANIGRADEWQALATLLVTNQHLVLRGATSVTLDDWSSGEPVATTIPLEPSRSPKENADALFHRARRMKKGRAIAEARRAETERSLAALDRLAAEVSDQASDLASDQASDQASDLASDLTTLEARAKAAGVRVSAPGARKKAEIEERRPYHEHRAGERVVYVGRGARDNDELTTKVARPWDLWLHAKGSTGAHVVVPLGKHESCPSELLVDAAHLAAHFSDARGEAVVEVQYTPRKYVRKPKGAAPGAVAIDREKVLVLRVEPARLARLLRDGG